MTSICHSSPLYGPPRSCRCILVASCYLIRVVSDPRLLHAEFVQGDRGLLRLCPLTCYRGLPQYRIVAIATANS